MDLIDTRRIFITFFPGRLPDKAGKPYVGDHQMMFRPTVRYTEYAFDIVETRHTNPQWLPVTALEREGYT